MITTMPSLVGALREARSLFQLGAALLVMSGLSGCTTLPTAQFTTYKETFTQARAASEDVLIDYAVMRKRRADLDRPSAQRKRLSNIDDTLSGSRIDHIDHVAVRMNAWTVVARYNDLLTALAEGKGADTLVGAVDGLTSSLSGFPTAAVAASAAEVTTFLAPLKPLLQEVYREKQRRQFLEAVAKGSDLIEGKFLNLLREDATSFYKAKYGLNELDFQPILDAISEQADLFDAALSGLDAADVTDHAIARFNAALDKLPRRSDGKPAVEPSKRANGGTGTPTAAQLDGINRLITDTEELVARAVALDAELERYEQVLVRYGDLFRQLQGSLGALRAAAAETRPSLPRDENLQRSVILLREALAAYKDLH